MVKVVLLGSQQTQWQIGDRFLSGGCLVELTDEELKKHKDIIISIDGVEKTIVEKPMKTPKKTPKKKVK